jgi:purine-binding chemotaxis protein CheW
MTQAAQMQQSSEMMGDSGSYLLLRLAEEMYALSSGYVREVTRWREPTPVPGAPATLPGIISHRGMVLPVVHLGALLQLADAATSRNTRYVVVQYHENHLALLVDEVIDLVDLSDLPREGLPATLNPQHARVLHALVRLDNRPVGVLEPGELIAALTPGTSLP